MIGLCFCGNAKVFLFLGEYLEAAINSKFGRFKKCAQLPPLGFMCSTIEYHSKMRALYLQILSMALLAAEMPSSRDLSRSWHASLFLLR